MIKSVFISVILSLLLVPAFAQELKVKNVTLLESDQYAVNNPKKDGNNRLCAVLKVYIDDLPGINFSSSYIIGKKEITYKDGVYIVYVTDGIKNMTLKHNDYLSALLDFKGKYNLDIQSGKTYAVYLEKEGMVQKKTQTVVFNMLPRDGIIMIEDKENQVEKGILQLELKPGKYKYSAKSEFHKTKEGVIEVTDVAESKIIPVKLDPYTADVNFKCNVPSAILYVDNKKYGNPGIKKIPLGKHKVRIIADDWNDYTQYLSIENESPVDFSIELEPKPYAQVVIICNGCKTPYLFIDNKEVPAWKNDGEPVGIKIGRHLITITNDKENSSGESKEKVVRINHNTKKIVIDF